MKTIAGLSLLVLLSPVVWCQQALAQEVKQERLEMEGTSITGNKELPNMLYIVPWQKTEVIRFPSPPIASILDQPLRPIKRNSFERQFKYHSAIMSNSGVIR